MTGLRFHDPLWLLLLVLLAVLAWWAVRRQARVAILFSDVAVVKTLPRTLALRVKRWLPWVGVLGVAMAIVALARPQQGREAFRIRTDGVAIEMCVDRSGSMQAMDFELDGKRANRLEAVKSVFRDFVSGAGKLRGRPDDLVGLVAFGGYVDAVCPLTLDHAALLEMLKAVEIPKPIRDAQGNVLNERILEEEQMTAVGDAVVQAVDRLKDVKAKSKVIILLSDGKQNAGVADPPAAAAAAKAYGIKIYAIGVGSTGVAPFPAIDAFGRRVLVQQPVEMDEEALKMLASATGGRYFNARDTQALENVYAEIDKLEKTRTEGRPYTDYRELYRYVLMPALALVLLEVILISTRFRSLP